MNIDIEKYLSQFESGSTLGQVLQANLNFEQNAEILVYPIFSRVIPTIRNMFKLTEDVEVVYYRKSNRDDSFIITNQGFTFKTEDNLEFIHWVDIKELLFDSEDFYLYGYNRNEAVPFSAYELTKSQKNDERSKFSKIISAYAKFKEKEREIIKDSYHKCLKDQDYSGAQLWAERLSDYCSNCYNEYYYIPLLYKYRIDALRLAEKSSSSNDTKEINILIYKIEELIKENQNEDFDFYKPEFFQLLGKLYKAKGDLRNARRSLMRATVTDDMDDRLEAVSLLNDIDETYAPSFLEKDYKDRKLIIPVEDISKGGEIANVEVFDYKHFPTSFSFDIGHPILNELYIGHPYMKGRYIPFKNSENAFMLDKFHELSYLLQCLGAEEIKITVLKGKRFDKESKSQMNFNAKMGAGFVKAEGEYSDDKNSQSRGSSDNAMTLSIKSAPSGLPFVPDELVWYHHTTEWQRIAQQRINGNMLEYNLKLSSKETSFVSDAELETLEASLKVFGAKVNVDFKNIKNSKENREEETEWMISVRFADKSSLSLPAISSENPAALYQFDLSLVYADGGEMTESLRRFFEKKRECLGLSKDEAVEIENNLRRRLSNNA